MSKTIFSLPPFNLTREQRDALQGGVQDVAKARAALARAIGGLADLSGRAERLEEEIEKLEHGDGLASEAGADARRLSDARAELELLQHRTVRAEESLEFARLKAALCDLSQAFLKVTHEWFATAEAEWAAQLAPLYHGDAKAAAYFLKGGIQGNPIFPLRANLYLFAITYPGNWPTPNVISTAMTHAAQAEGWTRAILAGENPFAGLLTSRAIN